MRVLVLCAMASAALTGCVRDPEERLCPQIGAGALIVTEIRGEQDPEDLANGDWVEVYNASGAPVDLVGIRVRFRRKDGSSEIPVMVRNNVTVDAGGYAVLGLFFNDDTRPQHVDYGFASDYTGEHLLTSAAVDVESCGTLIDRATYDALPDMGTFSFSGTAPLDANMNDDLRLWCTNATMNGTTYPGSPGTANPPCP